MFGTMCGNAESNAESKETYLYILEALRCFWFTTSCELLCSGALSWSVPFSENRLNRFDLGLNKTQPRINFAMRKTSSR